ncbi:MAG: hypothetical protein HUJ26_12135 [Planctomycetaceae bacterium]|nr:hypothetical protein [Planctomycetaceae bacterium]
MGINANINAETLLKLFQSPIERISQVAICSDEEDNASTISRSWGGVNPVFVLEFENKINRYLLISSSDESLQLRITQSLDRSEIVRFQNYTLDDEINLSNDVGLFDLDSIICPVPDWQHLDVTNLTIITAADGNGILGLCFQVNLGIRIGVFVSPYPGATLSFNDSCDEILQQAMRAETDGHVHLLSLEYPGKETPEHVSSIDWYDWLRT